MREEVAIDLLLSPKKMSTIIVDNRGIPRKVEDIDLAEKVLQAHRQGQWPVIDLLVDLWVKKFPNEVKDMQENIRQYREVQIDKKFATTKLGKDWERRFTMSFPKTLLLLIRTQFKADELQFDRKFILEFLRRYPRFKVAESS